MCKLSGCWDAEIALLVRDQYQRLGLGAELMRRLVQIAHDEHLERLFAYMLLENTKMQTLVRKAGFHTGQTQEPSVLRTSLELTGQSI